tara:strand:- start:103 stop:525 length:423 start_codon:yes stop_codon:yes gene_type:complete
MKFFKILCLILIISFSSNNSYAARYGTGELKLTNSMVNYFIQYIRGKQFKYPSDFYVTLDGTDGTYWTCAEMTNCKSGSLVNDLKDCFRKTGKECKKFAWKRTIKWNNGINPGKGKISQIKNKWSDQEIRSHLKKLGFID